MPGESATIHCALKTVLMGIRRLAGIWRRSRISNESQDALETLERARQALDAFIRRED